MSDLLPGICCLSRHCGPWHGRAAQEGFTVLRKHYIQICCWSYITHHLAPCLHSWKRFCKWHSASGIHSRCLPAAWGRRIPVIFLLLSLHRELILTYSHQEEHDTKHVASPLYNFHVLDIWIGHIQRRNNNQDFFSGQTNCTGMTFELWLLILPFLNTLKLVLKLEAVFHFLTLLKSGNLVSQSIFVTFEASPLFYGSPDVCDMSMSSWCQTKEQFSSRPKSTH